MTDDDRMDRAERIKRMREGQRDDPATADGGPDDAPTDQDPSEPIDDGESGPSADDSGADPDTAGIDAEAMETAKRVAESVTGVDADDLAAATEAVESGAVEPAESDPDGVDPADSPGTAVGDQQTETVETRVLEFQLGDERYCLDIDFVEEIVKDEAITRVPNTPAIVEGVVDLRGQITTILDPKEVIDVDGSGVGSLIIVFDAEAVEDQGAIGWLVDEVHQVGPIADSDLRDSPVEEAYINGVIDRDDQFVLWIEPDLALDAIDED